MKYLTLIISLISLSLITELNAAPIIQSAEVVDTTEVAEKAEIVETEEIASKADTPNTLWDKANTAYINGDYATAIELYNSIEEQGLSSDIFYFNLGNAHYKNNDMARAILYYQKALVISPNDADMLYNLSVAQSQIRDQIDTVPEFFVHRWSRSVSRMMGCTGWSITSIIALVVLLSSLLLFLLSGVLSLRKIGFGVGLFAAVILWISTSYALSERSEILDHNRAVIMSQSISIKSSPDNSATDLFMLHSGTTVKIIREIDGWLEIVIADGKKGWIESRRVAEI